MSTASTRSAYEPPSYRYNDVARAEGQMLFDKAWRGIMAQGRKSRSTNGCVYQLDSSCYCAIGHNLTDRARAHLASDPRSNNAAVHDLGRLLVDYPGDLGTLWPHRTLLNAIQLAHDEPSESQGPAYLEPFLLRMQTVAKTFSLSLATLQDAVRASGLFKQPTQTS
ncbi:hypothetical protein [Roseococcus pinisoli]|uniref:Uncharacterized protein n=1 Tax=Roseococcus pinisoli TaxID=2835040 RepID=A0ABS5QGC6_9PROT|nr:hypothetical protein [Roseococcus pinisoli]MBS7812381.1 hypothetical protein [Roseococcus pinisoli]